MLVTDLLRARDRDFLPSLQNYFEEAIEQLDPANGIEDEYKKVNNGEWGWRALRLMSRSQIKTIKHKSWDQRLSNSLFYSL